MKTHLLPQVISAFLLVGLISIGQPVLAAPQQTTAQTGSLNLNKEQISRLKNDPSYVKVILAANPGVPPTAVAVTIADALGSDLNAVAPKLAAEMVKYIMALGITSTTQQQAADVVSVFVSMVKGTTQERTAAIVAIGTEVARVVKTSSLAKNIVGITLTNLKFGEDGIDNGVLSAFAEPFKTGNRITDNELNNIVTQVSNGEPYTALPTSPAILNTRNDNPAVGPITKPESNKLNVTGPTSTL